MEAHRSCACSFVHPGSFKASLPASMPPAMYVHPWTQKKTPRLSGVKTPFSVGGVGVAVQ
jgi:hypothetical protein